MRIILIASLFILSACSSVADTTGFFGGTQPTASQEPGFTRYCTTHPHEATCP